MELSRKEEYRNQKVSIGVTLLSFIVMLLFFIYTNIITANSSPYVSSEIMLDMYNAGNPGPSTEAIAPAVAEKENVSDKIQTAGGEIAIKSPLYDITDKYKNASHKKTTAPDTISETHLFPENIIMAESDKNSGTLGISNSLGYDLAERTIVRRPDFLHTTSEQGKVVVEITVDENGTVTDADPNGRGTTTSSADLKNEARKMALATKFSMNQKSEEQKGTITIIFSFN